MINERFVWINMYDVMQYVYISCTYCNEPVNKHKELCFNSGDLIFFMSVIKIVAFHRISE